MAYKPFKMKGHTLPGINQKLDDHPKNVAEQGLSGSSAFQYKETSPNKHSGAEYERGLTKTSVDAYKKAGGSYAKIHDKGHKTQFDKDHKDYDTSPGKQRHPMQTGFTTIEGTAKKKSRTLTSKIKDKPKMGLKVTKHEFKHGKVKESFGKQGFKESKGKLAGYQVKGTKTKLPAVKNISSADAPKYKKLVKTRDELKGKGGTLKGKNAISMRMRNVQNQINKLSGSKVKRGVVTGKKKGKVTKEDSPGKWVQFIPMALSALSSMKKDKE